MGDIEIIWNSENSVTISKSKFETTCIMNEQQLLAIGCEKGEDGWWYDRSHNCIFHIDNQPEYFKCWPVPSKPGTPILSIIET